MPSKLQEIEHSKSNRYNDWENNNREKSTIEENAWYNQKFRDYETLNESYERATGKTSIDEELARMEFEREHRIVRTCFDPTYNDPVDLTQEMPLFLSGNTKSSWCEIM